MAKTGIVGFRRSVDAVISTLFVAALGIPLLCTALLPSSFDPGAENRPASDIPAFAWKNKENYPRGLELAFSDRFAFRSRLVTLANLARVRLGVSPSPKVIVGRGGWLFYGGEREVEQFRRTAPFTEADLAAWRSVLEARRAWLASRGIRYLLLVAPNKESVYPDEMPRELSRAGGPSRLDQLLGELKQHSNVDALDLRPTLAEARHFDRVYHLTDTHWNDAGAFTAYRRIISHLRTWFPDLDAIPRSAMVESRYTAPGGDLSGLLALKVELPERERLSLNLPRARARVADPGVVVPRNTPPHAIPQAREVANLALPRALVFCDSFASVVLPFLSEHFRRSVYLFVHDFPASVVDREHPDVVIEEFLERYLMMGVPPNPSALKQLRPMLPEDALPAGMDEAHPGGQLLPAVSKWTPHDLAAVRDGGILATGTDPFLTLAVTPFDAPPHQTVWVRMVVHPARESTGGPRNGQLFWSAVDTPFEETRSLVFPILVDGHEHEYRVLPSLSPAWNGTIENLRLDFPEDEPGLRYEVRGISLSR